MIAATPSEPTGPPEPWPLTPGEALARLFLDNADRGANHANDELVEALRQRVRKLQAGTTSVAVGTSGWSRDPARSTQCECDLGE